MHDGQRLKSNVKNMQSCYTNIEIPKNVGIPTFCGIPNFSEFHKMFGTARFGFFNSDSEPYFGIPQTPNDQTL